MIKDCYPGLSSSCLYVNKPSLYTFSPTRKTQDFHRTQWCAFMQLPLLRGVLILYNTPSLGELRIQSMCCLCLSLSAPCHSQCPIFLLFTLPCGLNHSVPQVSTDLKMDCWILSVSVCCMLQKR